RRHAETAAAVGRASAPHRAQPAARHEPCAAAGSNAAGTAAGPRPWQQDALSLVGPQSCQRENRGGLLERGGGRRRTALRRAECGQLGALGHPGKVDEDTIGMGTLPASARSAQDTASNRDPLINPLRWAPSADDRILRWNRGFREGEQLDEETRSTGR